MKSMNDKLQESREIKLNALIKDLQHWYVIGFNDEIINDDWRMFIFGSVQQVITWEELMQNPDYQMIY